MILESGLNLPINAKTGKFSVAKSVVKKWAEEEIKKATEDQIKVIWFIQDEADKVPTYLIHKVQRRLWEEKQDRPIINLGSAKQFEYIVGKKWGVKSSEKTASGDQSFTASVIERITISRMQDLEGLTEEQARIDLVNLWNVKSLPKDADWFIKYPKEEEAGEISKCFYRWDT